MKQRRFERFILGTAVALTGTIVLPILKRTLPDLPDRARYMMEMAREEVEDIVAEAQFERMRRQLDHEISGQ